MQRFICGFLSFFSLFLLSVDSVQADHLTLMAGDRLNGQMAGFSAASVVFTPTITGTPLELPWSQVESFGTERSYTLNTKSGEKFLGFLSYTTQTGLTIDSAKAGKIKIDVAELESIEVTGAVHNASPVVSSQSVQEAAPPPTADKKQEPETATYGTEEEEEAPPLTFLRGSSVMLKPGQVEGRMGLSYTSTKENQYGWMQRRLYVYSIGLNVGLHEKIEGWLSVPFGYATMHTNSLIHYGLPERDTEKELMDIAFGFNFLLLPESVELPEITLSLSGTAPTGDAPYLYDQLINLGGGHWRATAGLNFVRSVDPVVIFSGISATYTWDTYYEGYEYSYDLDWDYFFGMGMAVNDRFSFNGRFMGSYRSPLKRNGSAEGNFSSDLMTAGFGFAYRMNDNYVIEPNIIFGLNDEAGDPRVSVSISRKFN